MKAKTLTPIFTEFIPVTPEPAALYISMQYETAVHLCACGCGTKVVTPFGPDDWVMTFDGSVSLRPSVGNGQHPCRSHYFIRNGRVDWLPQISPASTQVAVSRDRSAHLPTAPRAQVRMPWWRRAWKRLRRRLVD